MIVSVKPVMGLAENATPENSACTISWTITAIDAGPSARAPLSAE